MSFSQQTIGWTATMASNTPTPQQSDRHGAWCIPLPTPQQNTSREARFCKLPAVSAVSAQCYGSDGTLDNAACSESTFTAQAPRSFSSACSPSEPPPFSHCAAGPAWPAATQSRAGPANCGRDTYAGDSHVPSVACQLLLGGQDDGPNKDKLTS